jgi:tetratricopeptide (TPR) repeat protein
MSSFLDDVLSKYQTAEWYKNEGNELFQLGQFKKAKLKYSCAIAYTKGLPGREVKGGDPMTKLAANNSGFKIDLDLSEKLDNLDCILKTNIATCFLKLSKPSEAKDYCKEALVDNPQHWKAELRLAEAYEQLRDFDECFQLLDKLKENPLVQNNRQALETIREIRSRGLKNRKLQDSSSGFYNMFERKKLVTVASTAATTISESGLATATPSNEADGMESITTAASMPMDVDESVAVEPN